MSVFVLFALLATCAASSAPVGEHGKKVETFSRFLEEADKKECCNCACGVGRPEDWGTAAVPYHGECGATCTPCDCDRCCEAEAEDKKAAPEAKKPEPVLTPWSSVGEPTEEAKDAAAAATPTVYDVVPELAGLEPASEVEEHESEAEAEKEHEEEEESAIKFGFVLGLMALAGTFVLGYILEHHEINWLPEAGVGVLMGIAVAAITTYGGFKMVKAHEQFDFEFFMVFLLPPIIFDAGYNMDVKAFLANIGPTMFFAFIGTFGSTFVVGGAVYYAGQQGWCYPLSMLASLTFGSLISATDPVTVLAVFSKLGVHVDLFSMVFGESVLNDAVAIVLSRTLLSFNVPGTEVNSETIGAAVVSFFVIFGGSLLIGAFFGMLCTWTFKVLDMRHHEDLLFMQCALSFAFPWSAFYTAEAFELSGIVSIMFAGMIMNLYCKPNFSESAKELTSKGYHWVAMVAETYIFVYLGMAVFTFPIFQNTTVKLIGIAIGACFVGRLHIYIGSIGTNCCRTPTDKPPPISAAYMFAMWFSGLRGGVAFALAAVSYAANDFPTSCGGISREAAAANPWCEGVTDSLAILQTTLVIAAFTIFVFGGAITDLAIFLKVIDKNANYNAVPDAGWSKTLTMVLSLPKLKKGAHGGHGELM